MHQGRSVVRNEDATPHASALTGSLANTGHSRAVVMVASPVQVAG